MFIGVIMTSAVSTYARKNKTCGLLINGFHGFPIFGFFLNHSDKDLYCQDMFHMCYQMAVPLVCNGCTQSLAVSSHSVLTSPSLWNSSLWCLLCVSLPAMFMFSRLEIGFSLEM